MTVNGQWLPQWQPLIDAFAANFAQGEEGAGLALMHRGELVVNVWAGQCSNKLANLAQVDWREDTLVNIFSAGKGLTALCVLQLVADGKLSLDEPVASIWPEFTAAGKGDITLRQILCHRAGMSAFHQHIANEQIFDWDVMVQLAAAEEPWWEPNTAQGYSPFMFGWILGELVKRASGYASFNDYFQAHVAQPLGVNCHFGVPNHLLDTIADTGPLKRAAGLPTVSSGADSIALGKLMKADPRGVTNRAFSNPISLMTATNSREWRQAQIPAAGAHANAPALASIYGELARAQQQLLDESVLPLCWQEQTFADDRTLGLPLRFSHGFMLSQHDRDDCRYGRGTRAFGHPGAGGCIGFADPDFELGFGYVTQRMGNRILIDERAVRLIDAAYAVLA
ncbi:serine hydrolase domain-containing protein [Cellvibrio sp. NN19]|uniref:serine hydrolase domain-containing protein n=1 Tax=Cellvibrio chitinivorans TaxID=3102792 RepID=UPI002B40E2A1|nr:serine hydrolase domain-containing protein [Cellvibrio sp. NN19]